MSIANRLIDQLQQDEPVASPQITRGRWFNIQLQPNLFAGEKLNVGVGFVDQTGRLHTRVSNNLSRLRCLYDDRVDLEGIQMLVGLAGDLFDRELYEPDMPGAVSPQLSFSTPSYAAGTCVEEILETFYEQTVSLVPPLQEKDAKRTYFRGYTNRAARQSLQQWMTKNHQELASRIFPRDPAFKIRAVDGGATQEHTVDLPLHQPGKLAGSIISAYCSTEQTAQLRLLQSAMTINTTKRHLEKEKIGLFVLRPGEDSGLGRKVLRHFDEMIDENVWQLRDAGVHVGVECSVESLGREVAGWAA
ncbi:hypothetical protein QWY79_10370 [Halomonas sabkhae]|uniref:hypothetical protein n=1 Tax=Halomonas sabkhae TaxID=626223 RepID=UPI0025B3C181|nr:hypothetical protein [Halomonas sabkhae]MDN3525667.1 hypothetical protein [Halomonas sabkhae]